MAQMEGVCSLPCSARVERQIPNEKIQEYETQMVSLQVGTYFVFAVWLARPYH
jgi:hypothetical protein